jgi:hypothetical protein
MRTLVPLALAVPFILAPHAARVARADDAQSPDARTEARERFSRGLHLFENGDNNGALAEFKRANDLIPNRLVQFNIGLVYAAMDRPVEAVDTLDKVLLDASSLKPEQVARARAEKNEQEKRIGFLDFTTNVPATIEIDGIEAGATPLSAPLRVAAGRHVADAVASGYLPARVEVIVAGQSHVSSTLELRPSEVRLAHVNVHCPLPGAEVYVDGALVGQTPLQASVTTEPGERSFEIRRPGYRTQKQVIALQDGARGELSFDPELDPSVGDGGRVRLIISEGDILVTLDGRARGVYQSSMSVPAGPHALRLERAGFEPLDRLVQVPSRGDIDIKVDLRPTPETREAYVQHARSYRRWAWTALISGVVVGGVSGGLALWGNSKMSSAQNTLTSLQYSAVPGTGRTCDYTSAPHDQIDLCNQELADAQNSLDNNRNLRLAGIIGAGVGVALIGVGVTLFALSPDSARYDRPETQFLSMRLVPSLSVSNDGAGVSLLGRF